MLIVAETGDLVAGTGGIFDSDFFQVGAHEARPDGGTQLALPRGPGPDLVGIVETIIAGGGIGQAGTCAVGFAGAHQGGIGRDAGLIRDGGQPRIVARLQ